MIFIVPAELERCQAKVVVKNVLRLLERMHVCVRVQTADCSDKRGLVTRRIKAIAKCYSPSFVRLDRSLVQLQQKN